MTLRSKNIGFYIAIGLLSLVIMMITALNIGVYEFGKSSAYEVFGNIYRVIRHYLSAKNMLFGKCELPESLWRF
jgi:hypothetical protein